MAVTDFLTHPFGPLYNETSRVLILGSFPSVKSREVSFYYGHPQNRFWRVMRALFDDAVYEEAMAGLPVALPPTIEDKKALILSHHLALWDSIQSCTITGSSDSSIRDASANDIPRLLKEAPIHTICCNGAASYKVFVKYALPMIEEYCAQQGRPVPDIVKLPSTSPANAACSLPKLISEWQIVKTSVQS